MSSNRRNIIILFFTLIVVMLGFGMAIPVLPFYIEKLGGGGSAMGMLIAIYALMQFFFSPLWGSLSDRYGRKPILIVGVLGNAITQIIFGLAASLPMLFIARGLAGILSSATLPTAMAFVSDSTSEEDRGGGMGVIGAALGVGMVLGPGIAGPLATSSLALPFFVAAGMSFIALTLIVIFLPESLPVEQRETTPGKGGFHPMDQLRGMWVALRSPIGLLLGMAFLLSFGITNFEAIFGLYALERFAYGPDRVGLILMVVGIVSAVVQGTLTGPLGRRFGEVTVLRGALLVSAVGFVLMLEAETLPGILLTVGIFVLGNALLRPVTASLISKRATGGQGVAMGLNNAFMSLGRVFGPLWAGLLLDINLSFPYLSGAIIMLLGLGVSLVWLSGDRPLRKAIGKPVGEPGTR
jgi:DHA1 family multidrug resistance protein-like MFS transporter